jgi:AcrR family transcriptional regulator
MDIVALFTVFLQSEERRQHMSEGREDRRVRYTRMVLRESFLKLLDQKDISKITVKEICEEADINRATFYAHYRDPYDLLHKIEDELLENVTARLTGYTSDVGEVSTIDMVERIFEYIRENVQLCKLLLSDRGELYFQKKIMMLIYNRNIDEQVTRGVITSEDAEYIYSYTITGCVGVIQKWLDGDMKKSNRSLAELLVRLSMRLSTAYS